MSGKIFFLLCLGFLIFSLWPTYYELSHQDRLPSNRAFELVHNFPTDYNFYLSRIREGIEGHATIVEKYTSEPHEGSYVHIMYLALGWIGRWVHVPWERGGDVYHMARVVLGMTLLLMIAEYAKKAFSLSYLKDLGNLSKWVLIAFLLAVTASTWPKLVFYNGGWRFGGYMPWWSVMDSLQRITFIPHLMAGQALILFLIMALSDEETMKKSWSWIFLGILAFLLGIIFPPGLLFVYAISIFLIGLDFIREIDAKRNHWGRFFWVHVMPKGIVCLLGLPALLYLQLVTSFYPWKRLAEQDILNPLPFNYIEYIKAVGPMLPLGLMGLVVAIRKKEKVMAASAVWVLAWLFLLGLFHFVPQQSPLRFSEMIPHVPLGILTAYLFYMVYQWACSGKQFFGDARQTYPNINDVNSPRSMKSRNVEETGGKSSKRDFSAPQNSFPRGPFPFIIYHLSFIIPTILIIVGLGVMYSSWLWQRDFIDHKMSASLPLVPTGSYVMYPLKDFLAGMKFIQDATSRDTIILSETTAGNYLPVYSGNTVYVGHANTVKAEEKEALVQSFFRGQMKPDDARKSLTQGNLHYIFFGPQEMEDGGIGDLIKVYPFLESIYKNNYVYVYRVK